MKTNEFFIKIIRPAFARLKSNPRLSLSLAVICLATALLSQLSTVLGSFAISLCLLLLLRVLAENSAELSFFAVLRSMPKGLSKVSLGTALMITPAFLLINTLMALSFQSIGNYALLFVTTFSFLWIVLFATSFMIVPVGTAAAKDSTISSFDGALKKSARLWKFHLTLNGVFALLFILGFLPLGLGLILLMPAYLYSLDYLGQQITAAP